MYFAIASVPGNWEEDHSVGFSEDAYQMWHEKIQPGTRVLIYKREPVNAIVAEAEVPDNTFVAATDDGSEYYLPLRVLMSHPEDNYIMQSRVGEILEQVDLDSQTWTTISEEQYTRLTPDFT